MYACVKVSWSNDHKCFKCKTLFKHIIFTINITILIILLFLIQFQKSIIFRRGDFLNSQKNKSRSLVFVHKLRYTYST